MNRVTDMTVATRKVGAEDIIMMRLPADRFRNGIPSHYDPPVDDKSRYQVALLVQSCEMLIFLAWPLFAFQLEIEGDYKEQVKNQYAGLIIGGGFEFNLKSMKLILDGRFSFGVTSILDPEFVQPDQGLIPRSFVLMLGISI